MKGGTVQISWHDTQPVLTLDFHSPSGLLATGGSDHDIKLWVVNPADPEKKFPQASFHCSLSYHSSAVNILRFSPLGEHLASGVDGGDLVIWKSQSTNDGPPWKVLKTLLFHRKDVLDLQWSADGAYLISGSVDNSCIIWDVKNGSSCQRLENHLHYVQGVAWDPLGQYVASLSSDRTCRIYVNKPQKKSKGLEKINYVCQHVLTKLELQKLDDSKPSSAKSHLFHDETLPSFFRRLAWSPDGSFLLAPAGMQKHPSASELVNTAYIISRKDLSRPAIQLPGGSKPVVAVRFCPVLFCLRGSNSGGLFKLPHRVVFAVATFNSLYVYDTESVVPIAVCAGIHYAAITDIAWSRNAKYLALSSRDGYCTILEFENDELGLPISLPEADESQANAKSEIAEPMTVDNPEEGSEVDGKIDEREQQQALATVSTEASHASKPTTSKKRITPEIVEADERQTNAKSELVEPMIVDNPEETSEVAVGGEREQQALPTSSHASKPATTKKRITPVAIN